MSKEAILEAKLTALLQSNAERDLASALLQSQEHANLLAQLRLATSEKEQLELKFAELESKGQNYPDNLSDGVPRSVLSIASPSYHPTTNKLLRRWFPMTFFSQSAPILRIPIYTVIPTLRACFALG